MFSLELEYRRAEDKDLLIAELWERGCTGIIEIDDSRVRAFFEDDADVRGFQALSRRHEEERDWGTAWREMWQPIEVGARFFLVPEWLDDPTPPGRFRMAIRPGQAFGTGVHETTQLSLELLERHVQPGMVVLDVGTGTGILAKAALLLGAAQAFACDVDPLASEAARRENQAVFTGSVDAVRSSSLDLIVANISSHANIALSREFGRCARPGGRLILSGFEAHRIDAVEAAFPNTPRLDFRHRNTWVALLHSYPHSR